MKTLSRSRTLGLLLLTAIVTLIPAAQSSARQAETIPGRYIVVYKDSVERPGKATSQRERALGFRARFRYRAALKGFAARLGDGQVKRLRRDGAVDYVAPDRPVQATAAPLDGNDSIPAGIRRIEAATTTHVSDASGVGVAIIDTGIDLDHPDLAGQVAGGTNCIDSTKSADDDHGHGTHVAGTVAAANNGSGVVGVAPGTTLYAVKVLNKNGSGSTGTVICGIEWVTRNAVDLNIRVANMSLGGLGEPVGRCPNPTDPEHKAICASTAVRVVYAVAAGNSGWDFDYEPVPDIPAAYPEVVTVSAMTDMDGAPGAVGGNCKREKDDTHASFSNFALTGDGKAHTIAAPGVCVVSTRAGGGTVAYSGTSMASPHVAGALALCIAGEGDDPCAQFAADDPGAFIGALTGQPASYGFYGDPFQPVGSRYFGHLSWVGIESGETGSDPDTTAPAAPTGLVATAGDGQVTLDWADNSEADLAGYNVYRSTNETGYELVNGTLVRSPPRYVDSGLTNGTTYHYYVTAVDTTGNPSTASNVDSATPQAASEPEPTAIELTASGYKVKGEQHVDLTWSGATTTNVDVYRDGTWVATTANAGGSFTHASGIKGGGSATYKVCEADSTTACSPGVTVVF